MTTMKNTERLANTIKYVLKKYGNEYVFSYFDSDASVDRFSDALAKKLNEHGVIVKTKNM